MRKISYKKILLIIVLSLLILSISTISFADLVDIKPDINAPGTGEVKSVAEMILGIIQVIAVGVALIMLVVLAIKYIAASPGEKADIKKSLTVYIVGALILFAGAGLLNIIQIVAKEINTKTNSNSPTTVTTPSGSGTWKT